MQDVVDGRLSASTVRRRLRFISVYSIRPFRVNNLTVIRRQNRSAAVDMYGNDGCIRIWRRGGEQYKQICCVREGDRWGGGNVMLLMSSHTS